MVNNQVLIQQKMQTIKQTFTVLAIILGMALSSCDEDSSLQKSIAGKWEIVNAEGTAASSNISAVYNLKTNGNATVSSNSMKTKYTYTTKGDTLIMNYNGIKDIVLKWLYEVNGNKMTLQNTADNTQKLELEK